MNACGIDVAKHELAIYIDGHHHTIENTESGLTNWFKEHGELVKKVSVFAYGPTGGYEKTLAMFLKQQDLPGYRAHANHVRYYAKALGMLAKTDQIDAKMIAEFAVMKNAESNIAVEQDDTLVALLTRREELVEMVKQETSRLETLCHPEVIEDIKSHISSLKDRIKVIEKSAKNHVEANEVLKKQIELISSIDGIGFLTAASMMAYLPEILTADNKSLAALCGLAPMNKDSGTVQGRRRIIGGRSRIRRILYMAGLSATRCNEVIKPFYERLRGHGKHFKVALTAVMRKLLTLIRSVVTRGTCWQKSLLVAA